MSSIKKVLITGVAGFIGFHCARKFRYKGFEVLGMDNFNDSYSIKQKRKNAKTLVKLGVTIIIQDLRQDGIVNSLPTDVDYIIHAAGLTISSKRLYFNDFYSNNFLGTKNLLEYAVDFNSTKLFINLSSSSVYGVHDICDESIEPKPNSDYGVSELAGEQLVLSKCRQGLINACSLRLFSIYGSRQNPNCFISKLIKSQIKKSDFLFNTDILSAVRGFTHISDIVKGIGGVINNASKCNNEIFNFDNPTRFELLEIISFTDELFKLKTKIKNSELIVTNENTYLGNIEKAQRILGYNPKTNIIDGLKEQIHWQTKNLK